jgi:hypothetical protein
MKKLKELNSEYKNIDSSNVISNKEMEEVLGGIFDCDSCKPGCKDGCKKENKCGESSPSSVDNIVAN